MNTARSRSIVLTLVLGMASCVFSVAQCNVPVPTKDAAAISALTQMVSVTGWNLQNLPADATVSGSLTLYRSNGSTHARSIALNAKGTAALRVDTFDGDARVSTLVVHDSSGAAWNSFGTSPTSPYTALATRAYFLPFLTDLVQFADPAVSVSFVGDEVVGGVLTHKIQVNRLPDTNDIICDLRAHINPVTVWINTDNGFPMQLQYSFYSASPDSLGTIVRTLDGWQTVSGLAVPLHQSEYLNGQLQSDLTISSVTLNVGLTDDIFDPASLIAR